MRAAAVALLLATAVPAAAAEEPPAVVALGAVHRVAAGETLLDLARAHDLGYVEILAANPGVDPWVPLPGTPVLLPTTHLPPDSSRRGLVVNLGDMRLYSWLGGVVRSFPLGIGREGWALQPGVTRVQGKRRNPTWVPPASIRAEKPELPAAVPPGPDNPLGDYSLDLARAGIRIHGTNKPDGVGRRVSHGCLRLYPEDIASLFPAVPLGTTVTVVDQPAKLGWIEGELFLEVHPSQPQADDLETHGALLAEPLPGINDQVAQAAGASVNRVDWRAVDWAVERRMGVPVQVTR